MSSPYEKIAAAVKEIRQIQDLISQGLAKPEEKREAFQKATDAASLFTNEIFKRRADKQSKVTVWTTKTHDGYVSGRESTQLDAWIALLEEYLDAKKIKAEISSDKIHVKSVVDGEDQHIFITEKGSGEHAHLIIDGGTGEIRVDPKDQNPHDLIKSVEAKLELKTGETVQVTKSALTFVEPESSKPDVRVYAAQKDGYSVLEIYNNGNEDLEAFTVVARWAQPAPDGAQERIVTDFYAETDYLVMARPKTLNMLRQGERVYTHITSISIDKKLSVTVSSKGMRSQKKLEANFELETQNAYK